MSIIISIFFAIIIAFLPFKYYLFSLFSEFKFDIKFLCDYLPISIFLFAFSNTLRTIMVRNSYYKYLGIAKFILGFFIPIFSLLIGLQEGGYKGLIFSYMSGLIIVNLFF